MKRIKLFALILLTVTFTSCDILQQVSKMSNLAKCEFRLSSIKSLSLAGVSIQNIKSYKKLSLMDGAKVTKAFMNKNLLLSFILNVQARNPNSSAAGMNQFDWILAIDNKDMLNGRVTQKVDIGPNGGIATIPLSINFNLLQIFKNETLDNISNIVFGLVGQNDTPTRITLRLKPTIYVNGTAIQYPGYINVSTNFTSL